MDASVAGIAANVGRGVDIRRLDHLISHVVLNG